MEQYHPAEVNTLPPGSQTLDVSWYRGGGCEYRHGACRHGRLEEGWGRGGGGGGGGDEDFVSGKLKLNKWAGNCLNTTKTKPHVHGRIPLNLRQPYMEVENFETDHIF